MTQKDIRLKNRKERLKHLPEEIIKEYSARVNKIKAIAKRRGITNSEISRWIGTSSMSVANKLNNESDFTVVEMMVIDSMLS
jgi:hypothetical protein